MPIAHISVPVRDLEVSKTFYLRALGPLGYVVFKEFESVIGLAPKNGAPDLWLHKCIEAKDGAAAKTHVAFLGSSHGQVKAFYDAAVYVCLFYPFPPISISVCITLSISNSTSTLEIEHSK